MKNNIKQEIRNHKKLSKKSKTRLLDLVNSGLEIRLYNTASEARQDSWVMGLQNIWVFDLYADSAWETYFKSVMLLDPDKKLKLVTGIGPDLDLPHRNNYATMIESKYRHPRTWKKLVLKTKADYLARYEKFSDFLNQELQEL